MDIPFTASPMTPADFRDRRAKRWQQAWAGVDVNGHTMSLRAATPPTDLGTRAGALDALQRLVDWYNHGGVSGSGVVFAIESLLQRAGRAQKPPCCACRGTGKRRTGDPCPEGCTATP